MIMVGLAFIFDIFWDHFIFYVNISSFNASRAYFPNSLWGGQLFIFRTSGGSNFAFLIRNKNTQTPPGK